VEKPIVSSIQTARSTTGRNALSLVARLLLALGASVLLASCLIAVGAPVWLSAVLGALAGARVAASRRLSAVSH
jgi:hypothetical protein